MEKIKKLLTKKDVCLVIATYNRPDDVERTLKSLIKNENVPGKIIIIDQSKDDRTKNAVEALKIKLPVEYIFCKTLSADISMNIGIRKARNKFKIILTSGDDVDFLKGYMKEMLTEFNNDSKVMAIGGMNAAEKYDFNKYGNKMANLFLKLAFLPYRADHKFKITGPYGHTDSPIIKRRINDAQWIPGFNMAARSEVYKEYLWPEIPGYNVLDDIDSSYVIYKKYGSGSLVISPKCKTLHRHSMVERYVEKKRIFVNHEDHFAFYYLHFNNFIGTIKLLWSINGIIIGNLMRVIAKPNKNNLLGLVYNVEGILCAYKNRKKINKKKYRSFLNKDLSLKETY